MIEEEASCSCFLSHKWFYLKENPIKLLSVCEHQTSTWTANSLANCQQIEYPVSSQINYLTNPKSSHRTHHRATIRERLKLANKRMQHLVLPLSALLWPSYFPQPQLVYNLLGQIDSNFDLLFRYSIVTPLISFCVCL